METPCGADSLPIGRASRIDTGCLVRKIVVGSSFTVGFGSARWAPDHLKRTWALGPLTVLLGIVAQLLIGIPQNPHVYVCGVINNRASLIIIIALSLVIKLVE